MSRTQVNTRLLGAGGLIQLVRAEFGGSGFTTTATITYTGSVLPTTSMGAELITGTITPKFSTSRICVTVLCGYMVGSSTRMMAALFKDAGTNAIQATSNWSNIAGQHHNAHMYYEQVAGTTSPITFRVRVGSESGTTLSVHSYFGDGRLGDSWKSVILMEEIAA